MHQALMRTCACDGRKKRLRTGEANLCFTALSLDRLVALAASLGGEALG